MIEMGNLFPQEKGSQLIRASSDPGAKITRCACLIAVFISLPIGAKGTAWQWIHTMHMRRVSRVPVVPVGLGRMHRIVSNPWLGSEGALHLACIIAPLCT